jgi:cellulose synthase/poly-beta-1,6-N-acetylglucosamine synthase-like glycosyltransferase
MIDWLEVLHLVCSILLLVPILFLATEVLAALLPNRTDGALRPSGVRCAVLVPAHDEEAGIAATLASIRGQLRTEDRLLVVADNCTDNTAAVARAAGADVVERFEPGRRGKGFALDHGARALESDPPDVVVILDADCLVRPGALDQLVGAAFRTGQPMQAVYLLEPPSEAGVLARLSAFAFLFKNLVRPRGLARLGLPCLLTGTGMAFPWQVLCQAPLASGNIVEDMQLGLDLACAGHPPQLCLTARVDGVLPSGRAAAFRQRTRWEHGHMLTLLTQAPRLLASAVRRGRPDLLGLALEVSVPPLSVLGLLYVVMASLCFVVRSPLPGLLLGCGGLVAGVAILAAWLRFGRSCLPFTSLLAAPFYILAKIPIYLFFLLRPQRAWVRTQRDLAKPPLGEESALDKGDAPRYPSRPGQENKGP